MFLLKTAPNSDLSGFIILIAIVVVAFVLRRSSKPKIATEEKKDYLHTHSHSNEETL